MQRALIFKCFNKLTLTAMSYKDYYINRTDYRGCVNSSKKGIRMQNLRKGRELFTSQ